MSLPNGSKASLAPFAPASAPSLPIHVRVVLNPRAGAGHARGRVHEISEMMRQHGLTHEIVMTRSPGHATELAQHARHDGVDVTAVVGGDGTLNEVIQAYVDAAGELVPGPDLALLPCGTGGDFKRTLGLAGGLAEAVGRIRHGNRRPVDLGVLRMTGPAGEPVTRAFVNVASFGIGGVVDRVVNTGPKWMGGRAAFFLATARAMLTYRNASVRVSVDGAPWFEGPAFNVAIANGRYFGGGMMIAPHADASDGRFEVVALGDLSRRQAIALSASIYQGAHLSAAGVHVTSGTRIEAVAVHPWASVLADVDGEQPGKLPLVASLLRGGVTFRG